KGMRQKVNIARALVHRPRVVFLDEPTSGLDVEAALAVREHVLDLREGSDVTVLICTHNPPEAGRPFTRLAPIARGRAAAGGAGGGRGGGGGGGGDGGGAAAAPRGGTRRPRAAAEAGRSLRGDGAERARRSRREPG